MRIRSAAVAEELLELALNRQETRPLERIVQDILFMSDFGRKAQLRLMIWMISVMI